LIVGLTGGVATGKSLVAKEFKRLGAHVIDADEIAREITRPGTTAYKEIAEEFGNEAIKPDGTIDRKNLGRVVFSDPARLKRLNEITHPKIIQEIEERIEGFKKKHPREIIVVDAPLLIEVGLYRRMDRVVVVYADDERQIERIMKRDGMKKEEAMRLIGAQLPTKRKVEFADFVIDGNAAVKETQKEAEGVYERLKRDSDQAREP
jgi:dephospho-CoA kinase